MKPLLLLLTLGLGYLPVKAPPIELKRYFACRASLLLPQKKAALVCYAQTQRTCQNGLVILAYETGRTASTTQSHYQIADTVQLHITPKQYLTIASCTTEQGKTTQYFVLCKQDALGEKYLRHVLRVWGVTTQGQLMDVPAKAVRCLNDDFGA